MNSTYTKKQIIIAILPWSIILVMVVFSTGAAVGWFTRSNFDSVIDKQVNSIMEKKVSAK